MDPGVRSRPLYRRTGSVPADDEREGMVGGAVDGESSKTAKGDVDEEVGKRLGEGNGGNTRWRGEEEGGRGGDGKGDDDGK